MMRYLALVLLAGCAAPTGGAGSFDGPPDGEPAGMAGAPTEPTPGPPIGGSADAGAPSVGGSSAGSPAAEATGGQPPEPSAGASTFAGGGAGGAPAGVGGDASAAGAPSPSAGAKCPADFYCAQPPDAFAKCVIRPADPDPRFPMCEITERTCYWPTDAPESCIKAECWKMLRSCG